MALWRRQQLCNCVHNLPGPEQAAPAKHFVRLCSMVLNIIKGGCPVMWG